MGKEPHSSAKEDIAEVMSPKFLKVTVSITSRRICLRLEIFKIRLEASGLLATQTHGEVVA